MKNENGSAIMPDTQCEVEAITDESADMDLRREYEELIRTKYKKFYSEDAQRMISRRLKKYKSIEERLEHAESELAQVKASREQEAVQAKPEPERAEVERARAFDGKRPNVDRPNENGIMQYRAQGKRRISDLTKTERESIAARALRGEIVKI